MFIRPPLHHRAQARRHRLPRDPKVTFAAPAPPATNTTSAALSRYIALRRHLSRRRFLRTLGPALVVLLLAHVLAAPLLAPRSTPRSDWHAGEMPELYQTDPSWARDPYYGETIAKQGFGPASLAMAYVRLTGNTDLRVAEMAEWATAHGYATDGDGRYWSLMDKGASQLGLSSRELGKPTAQALLDELNAGRPVICIMGPGTFTSTGHFIALERVAEDGGIVIRDPISPRNTRKTLGAELIASEAKAAWSRGLAQGRVDKLPGQMSTPRAYERR